MTFNGLPLHPLVIHVVVVLLPLVSAAAILVSVWPAARKKLTFLVPLGALGVLAAVPVATAAGNDLATALGNPASFAKHRELGEGILPWSIAVFVLTAAQYAWFRFVTPAAQASRRWVGIVLAVLVIAAAVGATVQTARAGDAGAHLVWEGVGTPR